MDSTLPILPTAECSPVDQLTQVNACVKAFSEINQLRYFPPIVLLDNHAQGKWAACCGDKIEILKQFLEIFLLFCLLAESPPLDAGECQLIDDNQMAVALTGRDPAGRRRYPGELWRGDRARIQSRARHPPGHPARTRRRNDRCRARAEPALPRLIR